MRGWYRARRAHHRLIKDGQKKWRDGRQQNDAGKRLDNFTATPDVLTLGTGNKTAELPQWLWQRQGRYK
ncbi:HofP DNA utilization family protein [Shigella flexneri]